MDKSDQARHDSFFGRRKGRPLRSGQDKDHRDLLPQLRLAGTQPIENLPELFGQDVSSVTLEIGFGGGEHLVHRLREDETAGFIGVEPFVNGMAKCLGAVRKADFGDRVRLWDQDAGELIAHLPDGQLDRIYLLYPDPWPKRRHWKRRFVNEANIDQFARILKLGGHLSIASDIPHYIDWTLMLVGRNDDLTWVADHPAQWQTPYSGWPGTRYEFKAHRAGRQSTYLNFRRN
jgi:tRNA (guanine-N7-)-methyltransferase